MQRESGALPRFFWFTQRHKGKAKDAKEVLLSYYSLRKPNIFENVVIKSIVYFVVVSGFVEGFFIFWLLKNRNYFFAVLQSLLVNGLSLFVSIKTWPYIFPTGFDFADMSLFSYSLLWLVAVLSEAVFLKLFYRRREWRQIFGTSLVLNLVSYTILSLLFIYINR